MPGTFSPAADFKWNRYLATPACITARASRTCRDACRDRLHAVTGKTFPAFPAHAHPQFCVSGKRPMTNQSCNNTAAVVIHIEGDSFWCNKYILEITTGEHNGNHACMCNTHAAGYYTYSVWWRIETFQRTSYLVAWRNGVARTHAYAVLVQISTRWAGYPTVT